MRITLLCTVVLGCAQSLLTVLFSQPLIGIYNTDSAVIQAGTQRLLIVGSTYTLWGIADVLMGGIRGHGITLAPMVINLLGICGFRLLWISLLDTPFVDVGWVYASFPISWACILFVLTPYWFHLRKENGKAQGD